MSETQLPTDDDAEAVSSLVRLARETAYDRYVQSLLVRPKSLRHDFLVLAAFCGEVARIPLLVREPMMGDVRFQWWHDVLKAMDFVAGASVPDFGSPLANQVAQFVMRHPKAKPYMQQLLDARRMELNPENFLDQQSVDDYFDGVGQAPIQIGIICTGTQPTQSGTAALRDAGCAIAVCDLLLRLPRLQALDRAPHLANLVDKSGDTATANSEQFNSTAQLMQRARAHIASFRARQGEVSPTLFQASLPVALVEPYLNALQSRNRDADSTTNPLTPLGRLMRIWWAMRRKAI